MSFTLGHVWCQTNRHSGLSLRKSELEACCANHPFSEHLSAWKTELIILSLITSESYFHQTKLCKKIILVLKDEKWKSEWVARSCPTLQAHGLWFTRLFCPWDSSGKNTGEGCHSLLQRIFPIQVSSLYPLHFRQILYCLSHQGSKPQRMNDN